MKKVIAAVPEILLCGIIILLQIENRHYGFEHPGIDFDSVVVIVIASALAVIYALIALFLSKREKPDFIFPYLTFIVVFIKLFRIIVLFESYFI